LQGRVLSEAMRRALVLLSILGAGALVLAGCGSSSSSANSPRATELSYLPAGSPLVIMAATDPNGPAYQNANGFIARFPAAKVALAALGSSFTASSGVNFDRDIKPLLGNPIALAAFNPSVFSKTSTRRFVFAFVSRDAGKLAALIGRKGTQSTGTYDGAKLYQRGSTAAAIDGANLVISDSLADVKSALDTHAHNGGLSDSAYAHAVAGLPQNALLQVYGSLSGVLAKPSAAKARLVPWVAAIRSYALALSVADTGITASYRIDTSGAKLSANQLPLPVGATAPSADAQAPVAVGIKQLSHLIGFGEEAAQAVNPAAYSKLIKQGAQAGIDLNRDIVSQFTGDAEVDYAPGGAAAFRAQVRDPAAAQRTLGKDVKALKPIGAGFYESRKARNPARVGIAGSELVVGQATPAQLRAYAAAPASPIAGTPGPLAFRVALQTLIALGLAKTGHPPLNPTVAGVLNMFGDITGYAANTTSELYGNFSLPLK